MLEFFGLSILAPVAIAAGAILVWQRVRGNSSRDFVPLAVATAFFVGYMLLPFSTPLQPQRHWHWLPYVGLLAGFAAALADRPGSRRVWLGAAICALAAWFLVPTWESLQPSRLVMVPALAIYLGLVALVTRFAAIASEPRTGTFYATLVVAAAVSAGLIAKDVSVTYGHLASLAASSLAGVWLAGMISGQWDTGAAVGIVFATLVGGAAFVGYVEPEPPLYGLLVIPLAPAGFLVGALLPRESQGRRLAQIVGCLLVMGVGVVILMATKPPPAEW